MNGRGRVLRTPSGTRRVGRSARHSLRRLAVEYGLWKEAMRAASDSIQVVSSKTYMRFYERTLTARISAYRILPVMPE
jgi:hypothetical protein